MTNRIGIVHPNLSNKGGAEAVAMNTIEVCQDIVETDIDIICLQEADISLLNEYYNTNVDSTRIRFISENRIVKQALNYFSRLVNVPNLHRLELALTNRLARDLQSKYDLLVFLKGEASVETNSIQYVHYPQFFLGETDTYSSPNTIFHKTHDWLTESWGMNGKMQIPTNSTIIANSEWTSDVIHQIYQANAKVMYPPVDVTEFEESKSQLNVEDGFVCVGRIAPGKEVIKIIKIIQSVVESGFDTHLHIIGPNDHSNFTDRVQRLAGKLDYITVEGEMNREELIDMIRRHKFAIHGKENEHFGMVVAEFLASESIPFIPNSGGQTEIVESSAELIYNSKTDASKKIINILQDDSRQEELSKSLPDAKSRYGKSRFKREMKSQIQREL